MFFIDSIILSVVFLINLIIHSGTPVRYKTIMFFGMFGHEEVTYPVYPLEWVGNLSVVFSFFLYWWYLYYNGKTQDIDSGLALSPLLLSICIVISDYFMYYR